MTDLGTQGAVVLLDCMEGTAAGVLPDAAARAVFVSATKALVQFARERSIPVIRVDVEFRPGHPEIAATNKFFSGVKAAGRLEAGLSQTQPMAEISDLIRDDIRVVKRRIGAFAGSDLEAVLRGMNRAHLILAGLVTRGAVLSTACLAADLDYEVTVVADACHDPDPAVHQMLLSAVLPLRANVVTLDELSGAA